MVISWCGEEARVMPWRGFSDIAYLRPSAGGPTPSRAFVQRCLENLAARGFTHVVTSALSPPEQAAFLGVGFHVEERLRVLVHDLTHIRPIPHLGEVTIRRATEGDHEAVLAVDHMAFEPFWQLDEGGLLDATSATSHVRFRVAVVSQLTTATRSDLVVGYAVTGRAMGHGFVQRLAVHPAKQGRGVGGSLVLDGLHWLHRWRVQSASVNTQDWNARAFELYRTLGFRVDSGALSVLSAGIA